MEYAGGGNLHNYLKKNFANVKWKTKLAILCQISDGYLYFNILFIFVNYRSQIFFFILDSRPFITKTSYIEISIVEISYL